MQVISETDVLHKPYASMRNSTILFQNKSENDISSLFDMQTLFTLKVCERPLYSVRSRVNVICFKCESYSTLRPDERLLSSVNSLVNLKD